MRLVKPSPRKTLEIDVDLDELRAFLAVAEAGSFSGGSKSTGIVRSTLARRIESLERRLGVRLLISSDLGVELTAQGRVLAEQGPRVVVEAKALEASVVEKPSGASPTIRCVIPQGVLRSATAMIATRINARHPEVSWQFETHPKPVEALAAGQAEMAIHWGKEVPGGPWKAVQIHKLPIQLVASRGYVERNSLPGSLADLSRFEILLWRIPGLPEDHLPLVSGDFHRVAPKAKSADPVVIFEMARQGHGLALIPWLRLPWDPWTQEAVAILPEIVGTRVQAHLIFPRALADTEPVRVMVEESLKLMKELAAGGPPPSFAGGGQSLS